MRKAARARQRILALFLPHRSRALYQLRGARSQRHRPAHHEHGHRAEAARHRGQAPDPTVRRGHAVAARPGRCRGVVRGDRPAGHRPRLGNRRRVPLWPAALFTVGFEVAAAQSAKGPIVIAWMLPWGIAMILLAARIWQAADQPATPPSRSLPPSLSAPAEACGSPPGLVISRETVTMPPPS
jgi:hypothetical protein